MTEHFPFYRMLIAELPCESAAWLEPRAVQAAISHALNEVGSLWPASWVAPADFVPYLARQLPFSECGLDAFRRCRVGELYLICACGHGISAAIAQFEHRYFGVIRPTVMGLGLDEDMVDDITQALRSKLFVGTYDEPPRILRYGGRGDPAALVQVAATRAAVDELRRRKRWTGSAEALTELVADGTPEHKLASTERRADFKRAFEAAARRLSDRDRVLLRLHYVQRFTLQDVGSLYRVHFATASRWIAKARARLEREIWTELAMLWNLSEDERNHISRLIDSQLSLSLERILAAENSDCPQ